MSRFYIYIYIHIYILHIPIVLYYYYLSLIVIINELWGGGEMLSLGKIKSAALFQLVLNTSH